MVISHPDSVSVLMMFMVFLYFVCKTEMFLMFSVVCVRVCLTVEGISYPTGTLVVQHINVVFLSPLGPSWASSAVVCFCVCKNVCVCQPLCVRLND